MVSLLDHLLCSVLGKGLGRLAFGLWDEVFCNQILSASCSSHINRKTQYENPVLEAKRKKQLEQQQQQQPPPEGSLSLDVLGRGAWGKAWALTPSCGQNWPWCSRPSPFCGLDVLQGVDNRASFPPGTLTAQVGGPIPRPPSLHFNLERVRHQTGELSVAPACLRTSWCLNSNCFEPLGGVAVCVTNF